MNLLNEYLDKLTADKKAAVNFVMRHSEFISRYIEKNPIIVEEAASFFGKNRNTKDIYEDFSNQLDFSISEKDFLRKIREFKMREYLVIAANDLYYKISVREVTAHISSFASAILQITYEYALKKLKDTFGKPVDDSGNEIGFAIIGLGKLGGWELNFSSDVDIIYVYGTEKGKTEGINGQNKITNSVFFTKLGEKIYSYLSERTEDGIVYRVDLRLRPDGDKGDIALPLRSYEIYYESYGQSWERMMLLKANVIAGNKEVGKEFIKMVSPFVFRRTIDYKLIEDLKEVKTKINNRVAIKSGNKKNVKLGYGGIREIEFIVQALQILNYPKNKKVFHRNTYRSLNLLKKYNNLSVDDIDFLISAYFFLRKLEHMAQIENELQTHIVPEHSDTYPLYLERIGFDSDEKFQKEFSYVTKRVNKIFTDLFKDSGKGSCSSVFDEELDLEDVADILASKGINNPLKCAETLRKIVFGRKSIPRSASDIRILKFLLEKVIDELEGINDPLTTLKYFEKLFSIPASIYLFYDIFNEMPIIVKKIVNIFSMSKFLSEIIISNHNILDYLYDPKMPKYSEEDIYETFKPLASTKDEELVADLMRKKHKELIFNAGNAYLNKSINIIDFVKTLSALAVGIVQVTFEYAYEILSEKFGEPEMDSGKISEYIILGMGKLGSGEMSFGSDLDLIFLYEDNGYTNGKRQISNAEFFAKLVQKAIFFLSTPTAFGYLYKIDMRLRPSGASGTLVTTISQFESYQEKTAMLWEKQALLRARVLNNNQLLKDKIRKIQDKVLFGKCISKDMIEEIKDMRFRIEREKGMPYEKNDIKAGFGGLIDIEFTVQMLQLLFGCKNKDVRNPNTHRVMHALRKNEFISSRDFYALHNSFLFFRNLENIIRAYLNSDSSNLPKDKHILENIGKWFGFSNHPDEKLLEEYDRVRKTVRAVFNRVFDKCSNYVES
jgi:glutamate-ammonia-ligase adenylyltransferase